ncbi:MAG: transcriptional regulator [Thermoanaerobaculia bacterium]|nr:transcriptional regulator [Thermoanaerobaculia bacterium]
MRFDDVRESLNLRHLVDRGLHEVPLEKIVGTLGRAKEFNRVFLPRRESSRDRWEAIRRLAEGPEGFPPIRLYKVGDAYFVVDGHHRVSVARSLGAPTIEAHVHEFLTPVPLAADESVQEVILKRGLADFLEATGLEPSSHDEFLTTVANGYERLLDHINVHRYFQGLEQQREIAWGEAVRSWYEAVYRPMIEHIQGRGGVEDFPGRTETDLYLFTMDYLHRLKLQRGFDEVELEDAVAEYYAEHHHPDPGLLSRLRRFWRRFATGKVRRSRRISPPRGERPSGR